ncbi:MAG: hypothetical protein ABSE49_18555 [Polyangiaceae bacterium]|jgi:hypothetical protein
MRLRSFLAAASLPLLAAACNAPAPHAASLQDNFATDVFAAAFGNANGLSTPYVAGSKFTITVQAGGSANGSGWVLKSSDPSVLAVTSQGSTTGEWTANALGAGHTTLTVVDSSGNTLDSEGVDVDVPTEVQLCAQGLLLSGFTDQQAQVNSVQMVAGGTATFLVRYFNGSQELFGNNAIKPTGSGVATASAVAASFSVRDFLEVDASQIGSGSVVLGGPGQGSVPVQAVDPSVVTSVTLSKQSDANASKGQTLYVFGRAGDTQGADVFGASFDWEVNGSPLTAQSTFAGGPTDMLTYQYDPSTSETIGDSLASYSSTTTVHGGPATTALTSSTDTVGCSVARGVGAGGGAGAVALFAMAVVGMASRRRGRR